MSANRIRFTVVSEPPEEEEQERECEDVGVAYLRIPEIVEKQEDMMEASLSGEQTHTHKHTLREKRSSFPGPSASLFPLLHSAGVKFFNYRL